MVRIVGEPSTGVDLKSQNERTVVGKYRRQPISVASLNASARRLKIAIVAPVGRPVPPPAYGPLELVVDGLARGLLALGHDVCLYAAADSDCPVPRFEGLERSNPSLIDSRAGELAYVLDSYSSIAQEDFDVVHDHTLIGPAYARNLKETKVVTTNHGAWDDRLTPVFKHLAQFTPMLCVSNDQASRSPVPVAGVIHHGIDAANIPVGPGNGNYFLFLGRMSPAKGPHVAARLANELGFKLLIGARVDEGPERKFFDANIKPELGKNVEFLGELRQNEKYELLGNATALLNPLQWDEPFGLVMVEAMATGTPVIAFGRGSVPEIVEHGRTGFVCKRGNIAALKSAMLVADRLSRFDCREEALNRFSHQRMAQDHVRMFNKVLKLRQPNDEPVLTSSGGVIPHSRRTSRVEHFVDVAPRQELLETNSSTQIAP